MISIKVPNVLFIKGVFIKDCITDDIMEKKLIDEIKNEKFITYFNGNLNQEIEDLSFPNKSLLYYTKLPSIFESVDTWPQKTNLLCWHCSLPFETTPIFIPKVIEPIISKYKKEKYSIGVYGVFCSFNETIEFIKNSNWYITDKIESINKVKYLYFLFYNKQFKNIYTQPSVHDMIQYGGHISINDYRKMVENCKSEEEKKLPNKDYF